MNHKQRLPEVGAKPDAATEALRAKMMGDDKYKALALADELYRYGTLNHPNDAADELRLLHKENATLVRQNGEWQAKVEADEALLRQALEALERGESALRFAAIAALRERLK